ncbi:hypothetical protein OPQ81_003984 [Rhizoctonia solani]|nr:hypothetical protein OPQ81_003984 [Rhizoctonia solani]
MRTSTRLLSAIVFFLSFGFIVNALPPAHRPGLISHREHSVPQHFDGRSGNYENNEYHEPNTGDRTSQNGVNIQGEVWTLKGKLDTKVALLGKSKNIDDAKARVDSILEIIEEERARLAHISVNIPVEAQLKVGHVVIKVFIELISACTKLSLKFGAPLVINLLSDIDAAFSGYILALTGCVPGLSQVLISLATNINADIISDLGVVVTAGLIESPSPLAPAYSGGSSVLKFMFDRIGNQWAE